MKAKPVNHPAVEAFARQLAETTRDSVRATSVKVIESRKERLVDAFPDLEATRTQASQIKDFVLANISNLLSQLEMKCRLNGVQVHWAKDGESARKIILDICKEAAPDGGTIVKAKSMATEEIHLNKHLIDVGYNVVETDLGEFVVQIDNDTPSHIVAPIIHKNRREVAKSLNLQK